MVRVLSARPCSRSESRRKRPGALCASCGPGALAVHADCPSCGLSRLVCQIIVHLNDDHRWTREKIGAWVAGIEPSQPPDDLPGGTLSTLCAASTIRGHGDPALCEE